MTRFQLRNLRLRPGEEHTETVAIEIEPFVFGGQEYTAVPAEVPAELTVQRATSGDVFSLHFAVGLEGPCMRCLEPARADLDVVGREYQDAAAGAPAELRTDYVSAGELVLDAWARDQIGLSLPEQILCRPGCQGLCGVCGKNLNDEPHVHDDLPGDPRWAALEALRTDS